MNDYLGHRKRLREKLLSGGGPTFADYEILEMLLFLSMPRGDTKPIAKQMLNRFKTLCNVLYADDMAIKEVAGVGDTTISVLKLIRELLVRVSRNKIQGLDVMSSFSDVVEYCQKTMSNLTVEEFHVLFLNTKNHLISDEIHQRGTIDKSAVYSREVIKRALELGASALILVHNHPSGDPEPSTNDILVTKAICEAGGLFNIRILDHIIVGKYQNVSLKSIGAI